MYDDLIEKHTNDPNWSEVLRLYSGLFDTQNERQDFILNLVERNILLAAKCKTSSVKSETSLKVGILSYDYYNNSYSLKKATEIILSSFTITAPT